MYVIAQGVTAVGVTVLNSDEAVQKLSAENQLVKRTLACHRDGI
jgi:hypothetical protein